VSWIRVGIGLLLIAGFVAAGVGTPVTADVQSPPSALQVEPSVPSRLRQIPDLLREIVEAVRKAVQELEDNRRDQLCSGCPVSVGAVVVFLLLPIGHNLIRRR
jgi:hypothetical protein